MEVGAFYRESKVLIVAGKGGVGKTTITAAIARSAADAGLSVLVVELEGRPGLGAAFGAPHAFEYAQSELSPRPGEVAAAGAAVIRGRRITPDDALLEYLADHGLHRVSKRLVSSGVVDVVSTAIPGIRDVLVLGKIKQLERNGVADLVVVDAPATGHAMTFLTSARGLIEAARGGPVRSQATEVDELLTDSARCRVVLVSLAEEMPVSETIEAGFQLEDKAGVHLGPVVVNDFDSGAEDLTVPAHHAVAAAGLTISSEQTEQLEAARQFRLRRHAVQAEQVDRLRRELPLPQLRTPHLWAPSIGPEELQALADAMTGEIIALDPDPVA